MATAAKLTCKVCGFKSGNLVPHIETEHAALGLKAYMDQHGGMDSVIHPDLKKKAETTEAPVAAGKVRIGVTEVERVESNPELADSIPSIDNAYHFPAVTAEVINDMTKKRPVLLIGHTGTGKTSLVQQVAARIGQPTARANMNGQTSISDFTGFWAVKAGETYWVDGVLPHAMKNGLWLIIDELDFAEAPILSVLNSVLESNGTLMLKEKGNEVVRAHKNFRIFATANAIGQYAEFRGLYQGTNIMNEAFLDRWRCYVIEYLPSDIEAKVLAAAVPRMTETIAKELVKVAAMARQAFINEELQCTFSTRRLLDWAEQTIHFHKLGEQAPFKAAESTIFSKISRENGTVVKGFMSRILLGKNP